MTEDYDAQPRAKLRLLVRAAGGLVVRRGPDDTCRVVLVHRPRFDDWSFPSGKQRRGESIQATGLRAVRDETGFFCVAEETLGVTEHFDRRDRPTLVRYWVMQRLGGAFESNDHVDAIAWLRPPEALLRLSRDHDKNFLESVAARLESVVDRRERVQASSLG